LIQTG